MKKIAEIFLNLTKVGKLLQNKTKELVAVSRVEKKL